MILRRHAFRQLMPIGVVAVLTLTIIGCADGGGGGRVSEAAASAKIQSLNLNNPVSPAATDDPVTLAAMKNESASFQIQISSLPPSDPKTAFTLRLQPLNLQSTRGTVAAANFSAYQVLSMPVDVNRAGYVRHTGLTAATRMLPRALLPLSVNDGRINLATTRDPAKPTDPQSRAGTSPVMLWVDLHIPTETPAGEYVGRCDIIQTGVEAPVKSLPIKLTVHDLVMPDERHLNLVGQIEWESLQRLYPERFEAVTPRLINRTGPQYTLAVRTLDELVKLAQSHRVEVVFPRLQPTVKWHGGPQPTVDWQDFDALLSPWMSGEMFADKVPLGFWPLPSSDGIATYDPNSQREYWTNAARHFDEKDWLERCPVIIDKTTPERATTFESLKISNDIAGVLAAHPRVRVAVPLEDDQLQFASPGQPDLIPTAATSRLITANPGIVFTPPVQGWPADVPRPARWMRTDIAGLIPYIGAGGDERDVRLWAWLSFMPLPPPPLGTQYGPVQFIRWTGGLPSHNSPAQPADPNELIWFYPGSWFGIDQPVPTVQLKWLRRAQQDFEYLYLARQREDKVMSLLMARAITKPVQLAPAQQPDPTYSLMNGTADPKAWEKAMDVLARRILLRVPGQTVDRDRENRLNIETLNWSQQLDLAVLTGRSTLWAWENNGRDSWIALRLGIDIYNPSDSTPEDNLLAWQSVPELSGWQVRPQPLRIPALATYQVRRHIIDARIDPSKLRKNDRRSVAVTFTNGYDTRKVSVARMVLPVATTDRREGLLVLNGSLDDWSPDDAIQDGPMVRMFNRPALQAQEIQAAAVPTQIFSGWSDDKFYVAFKATGLLKSPVRTVRNFVNYQFRRAWGEDLCQILVQPVYADNSTGPVLHMVCKPNGHWIERKTDPRRDIGGWQPFEGSGIMYEATIDENNDWRCEIGIPWTTINTPGKGMPVMLRFNFTQHRQETGESASWAGPIDFGTDDAFTGVLLLREPQTPGALRAP